MNVYVLYSEKKKGIFKCVPTYILFPNLLKNSVGNDQDSRCFCHGHGYINLLASDWYPADCLIDINLLKTILLFSHFTEHKDFDVFSPFKEVINHITVMCLFLQKNSRAKSLNKSWELGSHPVSLASGSHVVESLAELLQQLTSRW